MFHHRFTKWITAALVAMALVLSAGVVLAKAPTTAPAPTVRAQSTFPIDKAPAQFDEILIYAEVDPGSATPPHIHGGNQYVTVLEGELTRRVFSPIPSLKQHKAGETWSEITGEVHQVLNQGTAKALTIGTFLLPKGAPLTTIQQTGATSQQLPGPKTLAKATLAINNAPAPFDLQHLVLDFAPGSTTGAASFGGQALNLVLEGALTVRLNETTQTYKAGESWSTDPGQAFTVTNSTGANASLAVSVLLPKGASLMQTQSVASAPAPAASNATPNAPTTTGTPPSTLPVTGAADDTPIYPWLALLAGIMLVGSVLMLRRKRS